MKNKNWLIILTILFLIITFFVITNNHFVTNLNNSVKNCIEVNNSPIIKMLMLLITQILNFWEGFLIFAIFGLILFLKDKINFYIFTISTIFGTILSWIIKSFTQIQRPTISLETNTSFPSSHSTVATIFLLSSIILIAPLIKNKILKNIFIIITSIIFPLVIFSRLYLSVHWLSDITAGVILGLISFLFAKKCASIWWKKL